MYWMEESCAAEYPDELAQIRRETGIPMVIGEATYTKTGFRPLLPGRASPDCAAHSDCVPVALLFVISAAP